MVHELKTDQFNKNKNQIARILQKYDDRFDQIIPTIVAPTLKANDPSVLNFVRYTKEFLPEPVTVHKEGVTGNEPGILYADQSLFDVFSFPIVLGDISEFDQTPNALVISERSARKYFGQENPIGQQLTFDLYTDNMKKSPKQFQVAAVMKNIPSTSTIQADFVMNLDGKTSNHWGAGRVESFLLLSPNAIREEVETNIAETYFANYGNKFNSKPDYDEWKLQPLTDIHFHSEYVTGGSMGSLVFIKVLTIISVLILSVALLNYILLNSSLSLKYFKTQKILSFNGAGKRDVFINEIIYTLLQMLLALFLAAPLAQFIHQHFGEYLGNNHQFILYDYPLQLFLILGSALILGSIAAWLLERLLSGTLHRMQHKSVNLKSRQSMGAYFIVGQIIVFTALLMSSFVLVKQMNYIQEKDPGCDLNNTQSFAIRETDLSRIAAIKQELLKSPFITNFSHGVPLPVGGENMEEVKVENNPKESISAILLQEDPEFVEVYNIPLLAGRNLDPNKQPKSFDDFFKVRNSPIEVLVNESFAEKMNQKNVLGTILRGHGFQHGVIVGVVDDFHSESYYNPIKPTVLAYHMSRVTGSYSIKYKEGHLVEACKHLKTVYDEFYPDSFLYQWHYDQSEAYGKDIRRTKLISGLTIVTILISVLGLIGWSILATEGKTKEIGIRKVNGAKVSEILTMLNRDFVRWVTIASIVATPIAYYVMTKWLENFAYKTTLSWWIFALAGVLALGIALLTVSWQSWRAATRNPVEALRYE
ncbi:hypothetical protein LH29_00790 [Draconibacterium sediminis]|uniref:Uncharacterized protein n=2 Tax=Draconibacterium sediminis TaxID=1544798 RepID=A0A0D8JAS7_9BACT|nr:hypothetical protein LH29_00790 [Draconibacterium sediminis]